jgi:hypothetical protein
MARAAEGDAEFHVLVPSTRTHTSFMWTEGEAEAVARDRLRDALERLRHAGLTATGEVGDEHPVTAVGDVLLHGRFDAIILSTLPSGASRWLKLDLPHRLERTYRLPVVHVVAARELAH